MDGWIGVCNPNCQALISLRDDVREYKDRSQHHHLDFMNLLTSEFILLF